MSSLDAHSSCDYPAWKPPLDLPLEADWEHP